MSANRLLSTVAPAIVLTIVLVVTGCDNTIEPFAKEAQYSVYGYLSPARDRQFIRVKPLAVPITKVDTGDVKATVTLQNLTAGSTEVLKKDVKVFEDAGAQVVTHNYWTDEPVIPGSKYRLSVVAPDGEVTTATTVTPEGDKARFSPEQGNCLTNFTVIFEDVSVRRIFDASLEAKVDGTWLTFPVGRAFETDSGHAGLRVKPEDALEERLPPQPVPDGKNPFCWFASRCALLDSDTLRVKYTYLGPTWYGDIPEDSLSYDPLSSYDVSNGLGFFGSLGQATATLPVDTTALIPVNDRFCGH